MKPQHRISTAARFGAVTLLAAGALAGCAGSTVNATPGGSKGAAATSAAPAASKPGGSGGTTSPASKGASGAQVLPVPSNPITNAASASGLKISSVLVENNVDPATKKTTDDHLEIALENNSGTDLSGVEVYYTFTDSKDKTSESYYTKLPASFSIPAGGSRIAHFDNTGATDHFPVNKYSLYSTSKNALDVTVVVSATDVAVQSANVKKDAGGAENAAE